MLVRFAYWPQARRLQQLRGCMLRLEYGPQAGRLRQLQAAKEATACCLDLHTGHKRDACGSDCNFALPVLIK